MRIVASRYELVTFSKKQASEAKHSKDIKAPLRGLRIVEPDAPEAGALICHAHVVQFLRVDVSTSTNQHYGSAMQGTTLLHNRDTRHADR
ncbi:MULTISPECIES: hypothetical protein [unclassified Bradyrhizobium]|uniref:hypothetical protein n=1 Tax=unclassified Bradyrhizobium TaxID=2631580 RepID=UPI002303DAA9|nr:MULTISPECIES: hypothetical protein [unclassified Bradyrhizobium]